nr:hypothetical protein [Tanacetum cinerariifolium]
MEYLVKICENARILEHKQIQYPSRKIRRICLRKKYRLSLKNDMPPRDNDRHPTYHETPIDRDGQPKLSCEPTISSLNNNEIDFRVSFDESDDEDYTIWLFHLEIRGTGTLGLRDIADFKKRLGKIYRGEVHGVHVFDFGGLTGIIHEGLRGRTLMEYKDAQGQSVFTSRAWMRLFEIRVSVGGARRRMRWRHFILALGLHTTEEMETTGFGLYWVESGRQISEKGDLSAFWREISFEGDFLYTPFLYSYQGSNVEIMPQAHRLEEEEGYDIWESIYVKLDDTWAWVAPGPQRQQVAAAGALEAAEDALVADEGA